MKSNKMKSENKMKSNKFNHLTLDVNVVSTNEMKPNRLTELYKML